MTNLHTRSQELLAIHQEFQPRSQFVMLKTIAGKYQLLTFHLTQQET